MFDPSKYRINETADYEVLDAKGDAITLGNGQTWTITVASPGTNKAMRAKDKLQKATKGDMFAQMAGKKSKRDEMSETRDTADFLVAITESTNAEGLTYDGKTGMDALRAIYLDPFMGHVADGLQAFFNDRGNFYKG